ncbi:hypothetical protein [Devriesea agamarum]|uniref:hypothetical protein n=1 Tax=Devriesea agamarum TaxID=472569 RepID=UPI00071D075A|nr:hypothetical protein [Devriesea agamarum]
MTSPSDLPSPLDLPALPDVSPPIAPAQMAPVPEDPIAVDGSVLRPDVAPTRDPGEERRAARATAARILLEAGCLEESVSLCGAALAALNTPAQGKGAGPAGTSGGSTGYLGRRSRRIAGRRARREGATTSAIRTIMPDETSDTARSIEVWDHGVDVRMMIALAEGSALAAHRPTSPVVPTSPPTLRRFERLLDQVARAIEDVPTGAEARARFWSVYIDDRAFTILATAGDRELAMTRGRAALAGWDRLGESVHRDRLAREFEQFVGAPKSRSRRSRSRR